MTGRGRRILVADDDRFLRKAVETMLVREGYTVVTAADGEEALRAARTEKPDLILLDLIMPKMRGFEVLKALKADPQIGLMPVIVLSNLGQEQDVQEAIEGGALEYFIKAELSLKDLARRVDEVLRSTGT